MAKRETKSDSNLKDLDKQKEHERSGNFPKATKEELEKRIIKKAKRSLEHTEETTESGPFSQFKGFDLSPSQSVDSLIWHVPPSSSPNPFVAPALNLLPTTTITSVSTITSSTTTAPSVSNPPTTISSTVASLLKLIPSFKSSVSAVTPSTVAPTVITTPTTTTSSSVPTTSGSDKKGTRPKEYYAKLKALNESVTAWIIKHVNKDPYCILNPVFHDYERYYVNLEKTYPPATTQSSTQPVTKSNFTSVFSPVSLLTSLVSHVTPSSNPNPVTKQQMFFSEENLSTCSVPGFGIIQETQQPTTVLPVLPKTSTVASQTPSTMSFSVPATPSVSTASIINETEAYKPSPMPIIKTVSEEEAFYNIRCTLYYKKDEVYVERGKGCLYLMRTNDGKTQLIMRADSNLEDVLLDIILNSSVKTELSGNNVIVLCLPNPPIESISAPTPMVIKVKDIEEAQKLFEVLNKHIS